ncbi:hypothetical protein QZH41_003874 [Actinostola sp. cb2023]|nr:hypothetical protein QZH41_003874 [Actinostola sp. cb2023]
MLFNSFQEKPNWEEACPSDIYETLQLLEKELMKSAVRQFYNKGYDEKIEHQKKHRDLHIFLANDEQCRADTGHDNASDETEEDEEEDEEENEEEKRGYGEASNDEDAEGSIGEFSDAENDDDEIKGRDKYGPICKASNVMEALIKGWNLHLSSLDGGCKSGHVIRQMCQQIETIYEILGSPKSLLQMFDKDLVYTRFFKAKLNERLADKKKGMSCNTLLVYTHRLRLFAIHVNQSCQLSDEVRNTINILIDAMLGWRKSIKKVRMEQNSSRQWEERKRMLSPDDIINMKASPHAVYCSKLLNGSHVKNNERLEGKRVIHVAKHKTTTSYGGALVNVSEELYLNIWRFIRGGRSIFRRDDQPDDDSVFLGQYGNGLSPSYIHRTLKDFARKTNLVDKDVLDHFSSTMKRRREGRPRYARKTGRPTKIEPAVSDFIDRAYRENTELSANDLWVKLQKDSSIELGISTIKRARRSVGWVCTKPKYCQLVRDVNKEKRLTFCRELMATYPRDTFDNVIFTDESTVRMENATILQFRKVNEPPRLIPKPKHAYSVHVWAGISKRGATKICIFEGIMNAELYIEILRTHLLPFIETVMPDHRFQQDNDPKHTSAAAVRFYDGNNINWWKTPPESPDLNPIERVWAQLKGFLRKTIKPTKKEQLIEGIKTFWNEKMTVDQCIAYIDHVHCEIVPLVVEKEGRATGK